MILWLLIAILCSATAVVISVPLIRRYENFGSTNQDQAIYRDQLIEVDRDQVAGSIDTSEAEAARVEIRRRLAIAESTSRSARPISSGWKRLALVTTVGLVIVGSAGLYANLGSPELPAVASSPAAPQPTQVTSSNDGQVEGMISKLQTRLQKNPNDAEGWRMLGWAQFNTQHFVASAEAYAKALEIEPANIDYKSAYAESLVQSAEGVVTPKAQGLIAEVLVKNPKEYRARFYDALAHEQAGDQSGSLDRWIGLLSDSPADANWRDDVKQRVINLGKATGRDVAAAIALPKIDPATPPKPLATDETNAMVAGMIAKLAAKLEANPKDRDGWAMMIRALAVTGDKKGAEVALNKAIEIFKGDQATIDGLTSIAQVAGVGNAAVPIK
jgi:cytochrome c-type biogenesis protein CcmH